MLCRLRMFVMLAFCCKDTNYISYLIVCRTLLFPYVVDIVVSEGGVGAIFLA